ncbi:MAG: hypothetical protein GY720_01260 [bacterium]|nr:hypothetical protein [bacterium]
MILLYAFLFAAGAALSGRSPSFTPSAIVLIALYVVAVLGVLYAIDNVKVGGTITLAAACGLGVMEGGWIVAAPFLIAGILLLQAGVAESPQPPPHTSNPPPA